MFGGSTEVGCRFSPVGLAIMAAVAAFAAAGCFAPPEACHGCRVLDTQIDAPVG